jgi:hypothetical protein
MDGHGTTITFATSGFSASLLSVDGPDMSRESIEETSMDTEDAKEFDPAALYDGGQVDLTVKHSIGVLPPIDQPNETITIDWAGSTNSWSFTGHMTGYSGGAAIGQRMEAKTTIKVSGKVTVTPAT